MKHLLFLVLTFLILNACDNQKSGSDFGAAAKKYSIAYNIFVPDSTKDDWEVMRMNFDGTEKMNITNHPDVAWTYFAFKNHLFFISDRDTAYRNFFLYKSDPYGKNVRRVSDLRLEDSWMSSRNNGQEMVVSGRIGKKIRYQLFYINTLNGEFKQLTTDTAAMFSDPCFSPNGKQIVFSYKKNRRDRSTHEELYLMDSEGKNLRQITHYPENNPSAKDYGYKAGSARWHPTDNFISYVSRQEGRNSIFAVTPDGQQHWKLFESSASNGWHDWSSDGNWLVFNSTDSIESQYHVMLMNWRTREIKQLTDTMFKSQLGPVFVEN